MFAAAPIHGQSDDVRQTGSGLSDFEVGLRLRYEFTRQFAPYIGVEWVGKFGGMADFAKAANENTDESRWVAGLRLWF
jgi:copper resistance protein B